MDNGDRGTMARSRLIQLATVGAATFVAIAVSAVPANAYTDKTLYIGDKGYMHFHDDGDVFTVCDTKADGYGVTGHLNRLDPITLEDKVVLTLSDGGDSGCAKKAYDIGVYYDYRMDVAWHGGGGYYAYSQDFSE